VMQRLATSEAITVLVKASRSAGLEHIIAQIMGNGSRQHA